MKQTDDGIRIVDELPQYANGGTVVVTPLEIIMEFTTTDGNSEKKSLRVFLQPEVAKGMFGLLGLAIQQFERDHRPIMDLDKVFKKRPGAGREVMVGKAGIQ